ncbi:MAG: hypothetical protein ACTSQ0_02990 [Candidatus Heimdallarchaeota archaeon]
MKFQTTEWDEHKNAYYVDSGIEYNGVPTNTVSGIDHLEGETIKLLVDGATHPDVTVSGGIFSLQVSGSKIIAGLGYKSLVETMDIEAETQAGSSQGKSKAAFDVTFRLLDTIGLKLGYDEDNLDVIPFRDSADLMGSAPELFTGDKHRKFNKGWDKFLHIVVVNDQPLPCTILAIIPTLQASAH